MFGLGDGMTEVGRRVGRVWSLRDNSGGDDFAGTAPGGETVEDHQAGFGEGVFEVLHAVRRGAC